jgi:hypothetical protein
LNTWDLKTLDLKPRLPEILSSSDSARAIALDLAAGETLSEHEVHERAWILVIDGAIEVTTATGERTSVAGGLSGARASYRQPAARSSATIRGWPSISSSSTTSSSSRPTIRPSRRRPSGENPQ